jgi:hypothetical protein
VILIATIFNKLITFNKAFKFLFKRAFAIKSGELFHCLFIRLAIVINLSYRKKLMYLLNLEILEASSNCYIRINFLSFLAITSL